VRPAQGWASAAALVVERLELACWRNLRRASLQAHPAFNVLYGDNAQGKTNLLEAVYLVSRLKSFRDARMVDLVTHGEPAGRVEARVRRAGVSQKVEVIVEGGRRKVRVDGKAVRRVADHAHHYKVVLFEPEDIYLARSSPGGRRTFLDRALYNLHPPFLADSQEYAKALKRRNALLRSFGGRSSSGSEGALRAYDEVLAQSGARIVARRQGLVQALNERVGDVWTRVFGDAGDVALSYQTTASGETSAFLDALAAARRADLARQVTTVGPHRDDLQTLLDGRPLREHASQGQHRVFVLALKVTEIQLVLERTGVRPILLLDDVSSELDRRRNGQLFEFLDEVRAQVFLTTTAPELVGLTVDRAEFRVQGGEVWKSS
jgi:DNA replication and repair protein RecF